MIKDLIAKQQELMDKVPHDLRPDAFVKMQAGLAVMDTLFRYLNSIGHKPWRPNPLSPSVQQNLLHQLELSVGALRFLHKSSAGVDDDFSPLAHYQRQLVSAFGIIEETVEYLNTIGPTKTPIDRAHQLEEHVDILFFYLEQTILAGFTWEEVEAEYHRKHAVNLKRYKDAEKGDWDWDKRDNGEL